MNSSMDMPGGRRRAPRPRPVRRPGVVDQIRFGLTAQNVVEVVHPLALPARTAPEFFGELGRCGPVTPVADRSRGALEDVEMLGGCGKWGMHWTALAPVP